ncbi:unnamed protein product [Microthlaspi erraticum]|uniref:RNase H type-1 domain-containing protein n=1 Tax=Microthlaspi erraticum TaxID=1685480 RepID=A0A6D2L0K1_9BRAS|nr:unnamed protein product [Microthlaspi erraticum]
MNFQTDCAQLVTMVSKPAEWPAFAILLEEVEKCRRMFQAFSLSHIPRTKNTKADKLARSGENKAKKNLEKRARRTRPHSLRGEK